MRCTKHMRRVQFQNGFELIYTYKNLSGSVVFSLLKLDVPVIIVSEFHLIFKLINRFVSNLPKKSFHFIRFEE